MTALTLIEFITIAYFGVCLLAPTFKAPTNTSQRLWFDRIEKLAATHIEENKS